MNEHGTPIGRFDFRRGALRGSTLALFAGSLVHRGAAEFDIMALGAVGAVRVTYERDSRKSGWGIVLIVIALAVYAVSGLVGDLAAGAAGDLASRLRGDYPVAGQGIVASLHSAFLFLQALADALPWASAALALWGLALIGIGIWGRTTLSVTLGSGERGYAVPGRDSTLFDFAELMGDALSKVRR
jgi:hypothetical protein